MTQREGCGSFRGSVGRLGMLWCVEKRLCACHPLDLHTLFQITQKSAALWTEAKYLELADRELECDWKIFVIGDEPTIAMWLAVRFFQVPSTRFLF